MRSHQLAAVCGGVFPEERKQVGGGTGQPLSQQVQQEISLEVGNLGTGEATEIFWVSAHAV